MTDFAPIRDTSKADAVYRIACELLPPLRAVARSKGYALAYHGSFSRDIDIIAAPWIDTCAAAPELAEAIRAEAERVAGVTAFWINDETAKPNDYTRRNPEPKPHGRFGWSIHLAGRGVYVDLSVMPRRDVFSDVRLVRQEDERGCLVACLAMVTGQPYADVRREFEAHGATFSGAAGGITEFDVTCYLGERGYAFRRAYRYLSPGNRPRPTWPLEPFAPVHILGVRGAGSHGIVMLKGGTVLDPARAATGWISDYPEVAYMLGIWRVGP